MDFSKEEKVNYKGKKFKVIKVVGGTEGSYSPDLDNTKNLKKQVQN